MDDKDLGTDGGMGGGTGGRHWLFTAVAPDGQRAQGVVQAGSQEQALEQIGRDFPQLKQARILNGEGGPAALEKAARQRFGVPPDEVTPQQWAELADSLAADEDAADAAGVAGAAGADSDAWPPAGLFMRGMRRVAVRHHAWLTGLGVVLILALYRPWPWVALLAALGMAAPFAAHALAWRYARWHLEGLRAALTGDEPLLRQCQQALAQAAGRLPWLPGLRAMAWELACMAACLTARRRGAAVARIELLAQPGRMPQTLLDDAPDAIRRRYPLGAFEYLLPAREGDFATAAAVLEDMLAAMPQRPELHMDLAITRVRLGQFDEARRLLARVSTQELPPFIAMYGQGIRGLLALDDAQHADFGQAVALLAAACRTALEWTQRNPVFWWSATSFACELALALARNGQPQAARRALDTVQQLAPQCVDARRLEVIRRAVAQANGAPA